MMKLLLLILLLTTISFSCNNKPRKTKYTGSVILIGYKVAWHSHFYFYLIDNNTKYDMNDLGIRVEPSINLGDTMLIQYTKDDVTGKIKLLIDSWECTQKPVHVKYRTEYLKEFYGETLYSEKN